MEPDENSRTASEDRERSPGLREVFSSAWALWLLASTVGGAFGGVAFVSGSVGQLLLFGGILGAAQALVVRRYAGGWAGIRWLATSSLGWPAGWLAMSFARLALQGLIPELFQRPGSEQLVVYRFFEPVVWAVFAAFQCTVLLVDLRPASGRRSSRFYFVALWVLASTLGGALAVAASFAINTTILPAGGGNLLWGTILPYGLSQAAAGASYGAVTGVVFARIVRTET